MLKCQIVKTEVQYEICRNSSLLISQISTTDACVSLFYSHVCTNDVGIKRRGSATEHAYAQDRVSSYTATLHLFKQNNWDSARRS